MSIYTSNELDKLTVEKYPSIKAIRIGTMINELQLEKIFLCVNLRKVGVKINREIFDKHQYKFANLQCLEENFCYDEKCIEHYSSMLILNPINVCGSNILISMLGTHTEKIIMYKMANLSETPITNINIMMVMTNEFIFLDNLPNTLEQLRIPYFQDIINIKNLPIGLKKIIINCSAYYANDTQKILDEKLKLPFGCKLILNKH